MLAIPLQFRMVPCGSKPFLLSLLQGMECIFLAQSSFSILISNFVPIVISFNFDFAKAKLTLVQFIFAFRNVRGKLVTVFNIWFVLIYGLFCGFLSYYIWFFLLISLWLAWFSASTINRKKNKSDCLHIFLQISEINRKSAGQS